MKRIGIICNIGNDYMRAVLVYKMQFMRCGAMRLENNIDFICT